MRVNAAFFAVCFLLLLGLSAYGALLKRPYSEQVIGWNAVLNDIANASGLTDVQAETAKTIAREWVRLGPCEGAETDPARVADAVETVTNPQPTAALQSAVLQMVGYLSSDNFGRGPSEALCRFVQEMAPSR